jgi:glucokinase
VPVLEIGGSHAAAGLVDWGARPPRATELACQPLDSRAASQEILDAVVAAALALPVVGGETWAVACPAPFDYEAGVSWMTEATVGKFESLYGLSLREALAPRLPGPAAGIVFVNDADAFGLGEVAVGAGQGYDRVVVLTLGTGVGSAWVAAGEARRSGPDVPPEGEIHWVEVDGAPLEDRVSARAIRRRFAAAGGQAGADVAQIAALARSGDHAAAGAIDGAMTDLSRAAAPWLASFRAEALVLGGQIALSWDLVEPPITAGLAAAGIAIPVLQASPGRLNPMIGASMAALGPARPGIHE